MKRMYVKKERVAHLFGNPSEFYGSRKIGKTKNLG